MLMITGGAVGIIMCNARLSGTERGDAWEGGKKCGGEFETADGPNSWGGFWGGWGVEKNDVEDDDADADGIPISRQDQEE